jgi:hypothetical protein
MSAFDLFYLGMVITGMVLFVAVMAWATFRTRDRKADAAAAQPIQSTPAKHPDGGHGRMAA